EEEELLADGVENAVGEVHGGHGVGCVALGGGLGVDDVPVGPAVVAERGQPGERPHQQSGNARGRDGEEPQPSARGHRDRARHLARVRTVMRGYAMAPTTIADRDTSGACSTMNSTTSDPPKKAKTIACGR